MRSPAPLGWLALAVACSGGAPLADPRPPATADPPPVYATEPPGLGPDCSALHAAWRRELEADADARAELEARTERFPCELAIDIDGDGDGDRVFITANGDQVGIAIVYASGKETVLGAGTAIDIRPGADGYRVRRDASYEWIAAWRPARRGGEGFEIDVLGRRQTIAAFGAIGDGIQVFGGDAAAILYRVSTGWRWVHLGF